MWQRPDVARKGAVGPGRGALACYGGLVVTALPDAQVEALVALRELLHQPAATANWTKDTNFCNLPLTPCLAITCSAPETLTYFRIVGDVAREKLMGGSHKLFPSSFNVSALVATLLAFPELCGVELVSLGMWGALGGACAAKQPPSDEHELQSPHGRHSSDAS